MCCMVFLLDGCEKERDGSDSDRNGGLLLRSGWQPHFVKTFGEKEEPTQSQSSPVVKCGKRQWQIVTSLRQPWRVTESVPCPIVDTLVLRSVRPVPFLLLLIVLTQHKKQQDHALTSPDGWPRSIQFAISHSFDDSFDACRSASVRFDRQRPRRRVCLSLLPSSTTTGSNAPTSSPSFEELLIFIVAAAGPRPAHTARSNTNPRPRALSRFRAVVHTTRNTIGWFLIHPERRIFRPTLPDSKKSARVRQLTSGCVEDVLSVVPLEVLCVRRIVEQLDRQHGRGLFQTSFFRTNNVVRVVSHLVLTAKSRYLSNET
jgi:hypothetical protein